MGTGQPFQYCFAGAEIRRRMIAPGFYTDCIFYFQYNKNIDEIQLRNIFFSVKKYFLFIQTE